MHQIASQGIFISKIFQVGMPRDTAKKPLDFGHSGHLLQTIRPIKNPDGVSKHM